ncbi:hypothetical protein [Aeribacillus alveayuensis]|uniref:Uncharacterized protein n=1 Tax=Aeribacillus alveayuensis TaxID=279215 RepID=A0ABT9VM13_9BACI|nr:hypothetical protein [Bacillus alveayuensis]
MNHQELIYETKKSCEEYLPKLIQACDIISEKIQMNDVEWFNIYELFLEGLSWFVSAVQGIKDVSRNELKEIDMKEFNILLKKVEETLSNKDYVTLADLLEYELKEKLNEYLEIIKRDIDV